MACQAYIVQRTGCFVLLHAAILLAYVSLITKITYCLREAVVSSPFYENEILSTHHHQVRWFAKMKSQKDR
jgi:hypothetical protein